ncbi:hypothetical protein BG006_005379 [Podila minutissima]|uniref:Heparan-alpha-glucosaminide N-acetyltransferase n=1 Tax=Podila minutissima TaxID=64525 RepID=A0A9P5VLT6_9FUNG|nr:hypothetical protein BG006_005379 [Podila minutissima]
MDDGLHRRRGSTSSQSDHPSNTSTPSPFTFNPDRPQFNSHSYDSSEFIPLTLTSSSTGPTPERSDNSLASLCHANSYAEFQVRVIGNPSEPSKSSFMSDGQPSGSRGSGISSSPPPTEAPQQEVTSKPIPNPASKRLQSLDILRGVTIVLMIFVNTQGADPFIQLIHPTWFGFHLADWVFPNFIFMVGMSVAIVLSPSRVAAMIGPNSTRGSSVEVATAAPSLWKRHRIRIKAAIRIVKRSLILFSMGLVLNAFELIGQSGDLWLRIPGVLQRIAFCYCILATAVLWAPLRYNHVGNGIPRQSRYVAYGLPIVFTALWFILTYGVRSTATVPIDECTYPPSAYILPNGSRTDLPQGPPSRGQISSPLCTAQSYLDTLLFDPGHDPNNPMFDTEGTLGSLMAVVTAWFGWITGTWVVEQQRLQKANDKRLAESLQPTSESESEPSTGLGTGSTQKAAPEAQQQRHNCTVVNPQRIENERRRFLLSYLGEWFAVGVPVMFAGAILDWFLPNMKALWTPSYTLYTAGISINLLCLLMYIYDLPNAPLSSTGGGSHSIASRLWTSCWHVLSAAGRFATKILICYGRNPTLIYMLSETVQILMEKIPAKDASLDWVESAWAWIFFNTFFKIMPPAWASICFSAVYILLFAPLLWFLDSCGWYLKV